jgi:hypothetical protein
MDGLASLRLSQSANLGNSQVKILMTYAPLYAAIAMSKFGEFNFAAFGIAGARA